MTLLVLMLLGGSYGGFPPSRLVGADAPLRRALEEFRGLSFERGHAWTWDAKAVLLTQFPLTRSFHVEADIPLGGRPWRDLACLDLAQLPKDDALLRVAQRATYMVVTQAPEGTECVVNTIVGAEIDQKVGVLKQLEHAEVIACKDVAARVTEFGASAAVVAQISAVLKAPLPWNPAFDGPEARRDAGAVHTK